MEPIDDALTQRAALHDAVLGLDVLGPVRPVGGIVRTDRDERLAAFVLDLDPRLRLVDRDRRVGLQHHHRDDQHERGPGQPAMFEDGVQPVEQVDRL